MRQRRREKKKCRYKSHGRLPLLYLRFFLSPCAYGAKVDALRSERPIVSKLLISVMG